MDASMDVQNSKALPTPLSALFFFSFLLGQALSVTRCLRNAGIQNATRTLLQRPYRESGRLLPEDCKK